jgi:FAD/FMN-containing dehydrogenase
VLVTDDDAGRMADHIAYARDYWNAQHPFTAGGAYLNMVMDEGSDRVKDSFRNNYPRLQAIKAQVDPSNRFRINQNIAPN